MKKEFEIGQRVKWKVGGFDLWGLFIEMIDDTKSSVKCISRNGERHIQTVEVLTELLENYPE
jgi:hypothetical protein